MTPSKLPKSLHTVTALVNVAIALRSARGVAISNVDAVTDALIALGYRNTPDEYNLASAAVKILDKRG